MAPRTIADMAEALRRHVTLLRAYMQKAYDERDDNSWAKSRGICVFWRLRRARIRRC